MSRVLFVCLHNAGRSQMSETLFARATQGRHEARSAGTQPAERVHPEVVEAMRELGIDLAGRRPRRLAHEDAEWYGCRKLGFGAGCRGLWVPRTSVRGWSTE